MYVDQLQFTTVFLPLLSADYYSDGNSPGKHPGNSGNRTLKAGSSPPPSRGERSIGKASASKLKIYAKNDGRYQISCYDQTGKRHVAPTKGTLAAAKFFRFRLAFQVIPNVVIGADLWFLRHYEGLGLGSFTGDAVYLGPTFFWKIGPKTLVSASWEAQIAGHQTGDASPLNLADFSRQRARLVFEFEF